MFRIARRGNARELVDRERGGCAGRRGVEDRRRGFHRDRFGHRRHGERHRQVHVLADGDNRVERHGRET